MLNFHKKFKVNIASSHKTCKEFTHSNSQFKINLKDQNNKKIKVMIQVEIVALKIMMKKLMKASIFFYFLFSFTILNNFVCTF